MSLKHPEIGNVGFLCINHTRKPDPKFADMPVESFIGKFCKVGVPFEENRNEFMWFRVVGKAEHPEEELRGELFNHPAFVNMVHGDLIEFSRREIIEITDTCG